MNREIKFRIWRKSQKTSEASEQYIDKLYPPPVRTRPGMRELDLIDEKREELRQEIINKFPIWEMIYPKEFGEMGDQFGWSDRGYVDTSCRGSNLDIEPNFILMQYTGLKDKNNKEIYEGDILKISFKEMGVSWEFNGTVIYDVGEAAFLIKTVSETLKFFQQIQEIEVVDNIFENPELLNK